MTSPQPPSAADRRSGGHEPSGPDEDAAPTDDDRVMSLLSEHVPLSLLLDLSAPAGPDSERILDDEGEPEDAWWEPPA